MDLPSYNVALVLVTKAALVENVNDILEELLDNSTRFQPDNTTLSILLEFHSMRGDLGSVKICFRRLSKYLEPDATSYHIYLAAHERLGEQGEVESITQAMKRRGFFKAHDPISWSLTQRGERGREFFNRSTGPDKTVKALETRLSYKSDFSALPLLYREHHSDEMLHKTLMGHAEKHALAEVLDRDAKPCVEVNMRMCVDCEKFFREVAIMFGKEVLCKGNQTKTFFPDGTVKTI